MSEHIGPGPDHDTLKRLNMMLPGMMQAHHEKAKGHLTRATQKPRKICEICCATFDNIVTKALPELETSRCEKCKKLLADGCIALVSGNEYAFIKSPELADMAGELVPVESIVFEKLKERYASGIQRN